EPFGNVRCKFKSCCPYGKALPFSKHTFNRHWWLNSENAQKTKIFTMAFLNALFPRQGLTMKNLRPPEGGAGIKYIRIKDSSRLRDDCLFFSGPWYPTSWGW